LKYTIAHRAALPVRDNFIFIDRHRIIGYAITGHSSGIQYVKVFDGVAGKFRKCGNCPGKRSALSDDQLVFTDVDGFFSHRFLKFRALRTGYEYLP
jgi:hypothetical protein